MSIERLSKTAILSASLVIAGAVDTPALAQTASAAAANPAEAPASDGETLQEVTVTANRRSERLQDVPISVAAQSGEALQDLNIKRPEQLTMLFPGFTSIPNAGSAAVSYNIRGVGQSDFSEHEEQPVTAYQDGVYVANAAATGFPLFDIDRVELLRGPQGTLFGRNSTGGLVQFISNQPSAGVSGYAEVTSGAYQLRRFEGAFNYGTDTLAVRLATFISDRDGYVKNTLGQNLLAETIAALRLQVLWKPTDSTRLTLRLEGFTSTGTSENKAAPAAFNNQGIPYLIPANQNPWGTCNGCDLYGYRDGPSPYVESVNDAGTIQKRPRTAAVTLEQGLTEHVKFYSISSYTAASEDYREDTDGTPNYVFFNEDHTYEHTYTQELRLQGEGAFTRWTTGVYAMDIDGSYFIENGIPTICDPLNTTTCIYAGDPPLDGVNGKGAVSGSYYRLETRSIAGYAQGEYDFTSQLTGVVGARVTHDANYFDYSYFCTQTEAGACTAIFGTGIATSVKNLPPGVYHLSQDHNLPSGKIGLNYKVTPDILTYVSLNRGVKGAGYIYSYDGTLPLNQLSFKPERLTSLEGGIKSGWWDHRITADLSLFHYHYKDFQTFQFSGVSATVVNKDALANGGELELNAKPGAGFAVNLGVAYDNMWVHWIPTFNGVVEDQRAINAPVWQMNWGVAKTWQLPDDSTFRIGYDGRYTGERWFNIVNEAVVRDPSDIIHDVDFTLSTGSHFSYRGYITNFTNKAVANVRFDQTGQGFVLTHWDPPRMWGLAVDYKF